jgi:hypothetical protein
VKHASQEIGGGSRRRLTAALQHGARHYQEVTWQEVITNTLEMPKIEQFILQAFHTFERRKRVRVGKTAVHHRGAFIFSSTATLVLMIYEIGVRGLFHEYEGSYTDDLGTAL